MGRNKTESQEVPTQPQDNNGTDTAADQKARGNKCPECEGRGIRPEVDETSVCAHCEGSGLVD